MEEGEVFSEDNLRPIRPGLGLPVKYYSTFMGKKVNKATKKGTPLGWELIG
jgi:sialic acid synthase SpsE